VRELLALHRDGRLAGSYPSVPGLLATATPEEVVRAGQLLTRLDPGEVLAAHPDTTTLSVTVLGHGTLSPLLAPLAGEAARHGLLFRTRVADFDSWVFELGDADSALYAEDPDLALCVLDPTVVFDEVPVPWRPEDVGRVLEGKIALVERLAARFAATARGVLVLNTLPLPRRWTAQLVDHRSRAELGALWREANARLLRLAGANPSVVVLDLDPLLAEGVPLADPRLDVYAKAHLSGALLAGYAREVTHLARHLTGRTRKVLALDLDRTVWGGVLGDDGLEGIEVAGGHRGEAFRAFQRVAKQLGSQGVLLAAVSKNDPEPVARVLREHPEMTLREEDFVSVAAAWRPKPESIAELARALNLAVGSVVFADDSPFERGLVRHALPEVAVVDLDDEPALHVERLLRDGWFDVRELTGEDRERGALYRGELARGDFLQSFTSTEDYLAELGVRVVLRPAAEADLPRLSQITLRTNQFNLTTRRLQPGEVRDFAARPGAGVLTVRSADRFGENGLVGAVFLETRGEALHIDNALLSCRVFSRGIEQAALAAVLRLAAESGHRAVTGSHRPTAKNATVRDLLPRHGFRTDPEAAAEGAERGDPPGTSYFRHDLGAPDGAAATGDAGAAEDAPAADGPYALLAVPAHIDLDADLTGLLEGTTT
jgi:FkbH-like protein